MPVYMCTSILGRLSHKQKSCFCTKACPTAVFSPQIRVLQDYEIHAYVLGVIK